MAAPNGDFQFTEGHVRLLLWMCENHQDWLDSASNEILKNGEMPSENLMNCREGITDLKCWGLRLLEIIEATPDDDDYEDDDFDDEDDDDSLELGDFAAHLERQWVLHRGARSRGSRNPLQKLRSWLLSVLQ